MLADGADGFGTLVATAIGRKCAKRLDWFRGSVRLQHIAQMWSSIRARLQADDAVDARVRRVRWRIWHGRWRLASTQLRCLARIVVEAAKNSLATKDQHQRLRFGLHLIKLRRCLHGNARQRTEPLGETWHLLRIVVSPCCR